MGWNSLPATFATSRGSRGCAYVTPARCDQGASRDDLLPLRDTLGQARIGVRDARAQHAPGAKLLAQVARARDRLLPARAVRGEEPDLSPARGLGLAHLD